MAATAEEDVVGRYLELGLRLGRHLEGLVDAYYGPPAVAARVGAEPLRPLAALRGDAERLIADLAAGAIDDPARRRWLLGQVGGLLTVARKLAGEEIGYSDEVESCYGVRPRWLDEEELHAAHRELDAALPQGRGAAGDSLADRLIAWREAHAVPPEKLQTALGSLAADFRARTASAFGLPEGEHVEFVLETGRPWSGFNYYLGGLRSRVAINVDLPVLSITLGHLVAHEAYPGHHTEHCLKEVGLVRRRAQLEESIFLVGTPQCLVTEGLADLGIEVLLGDSPEPVIAEHLRPLHIRYDSEVVARVRRAAEVLSAVRGNVALLLHEKGAAPSEAIEYYQRWGLQSRQRAAKAVEFLTDPTWRAYISCYVEGLPLCRRFAGGSPERYARLLTEQLLPGDLAAA